MSAIGRVHFNNPFVLCREAVLCREVKVSTVRREVVFGEIVKIVSFVEKLSFVGVSYIFRCSQVVSPCVLHVFSMWRTCG